MLYTIIIEFIIVVASLPVYSQLGRTALHLAANSGKLESVKALVKEFGVDPDITDSVSISSYHEYNTMYTECLYMFILL